MKTHIKICGITSIEDARQAAYLGADYIGIIVGVSGSPRSLPVIQAARLRAACTIPVIVLSDMPAARLRDALAIIQPDGVQLVGTYPEDSVCNIKQNLHCALWRTFYIPPADEKHTTSDLLQAYETFCRAGVDVVVCDTGIPGKKGGTGVTGNWLAARELVEAGRVPVFLAGGITPDNVRDALTLVNPYGIDVSSGVEQRPGEKDYRKIKRLVQIVREYDAHRTASSGTSCS